MPRTLTQNELAAAAQPFSGQEVSHAILPKVYERLREATALRREELQQELKILHQEHSSKLMDASRNRFVPARDGSRVYDQDFIYDAQLKVSGDFGDQQVRERYAHWLASLLNAGINQSGLSPTTDSVPLPTSEDQAVAMLLTAHCWLKEHAPHRLKGDRE